MVVDIITVCSLGAIASLVLGGGYVIYQRYLNDGDNDTDNFVSNFRYTKKDKCLGSGD